MKINCDLGEGLADIDTLLIPLVDQASVACGGHTGDDSSMAHCIQLAHLHQTEIGIHPSYPDRENFGRKSLNISHEELSQSLQSQILHFLDLCAHERAIASYVKAHGALYNDLVRDGSLLAFFLGVITEINQQQNLDTPLAVMLSASLRNTTATTLAKKLNLRLLFEAFADRVYCDDGSLQTRSEASAVLTDPAKIVSQFSSLANCSGVTTVNGKWLDLPADSVCVHGDNPAVVQAIKTIRKLA